MTAQECSRCKRLDCSWAAGQRSESAYESCLTYTTARAEQAEGAVLRAGRDSKWSAIYAWCDDNKDALVKSLGDQNGKLERENMVLKERVAYLEKSADELIVGDLTEALTAAGDGAKKQIDELNTEVERLEENLDEARGEITKLTARFEVADALAKRNFEYGARADRIGVELEQRAIAAESLLRSVERSYEHEYSGTGAPWVCGWCRGIVTFISSQRTHVEHKPDCFELKRVELLKKVSND